MVCAFRIPANTPLSLQPLDAEGKAIQLMRSWMTAMPGEVVQCSGCHEPQNTAPPASLATSLALHQPPAEIKPWYGPTRGFSYAREVQPVIDKHCVSCHNGQPWSDGREIADLRGTVRITDWSSNMPGNGGEYAGKFSVGYAELHRYVRRPGIESDYHLLEPLEFHADTTQLVQTLAKGHYNVQLDAEAWDRLITWIDLNCPFHGTWGEELASPGTQRERRRELLKLYAGVDDDPEAIPPAAVATSEPIVPPPAPAVESPVVQCANWPFDAAEAAAPPVRSRSHHPHATGPGAGCPPRPRTGPRRRVHHGQRRGRGGRTSPDACADRSTVLDGYLRGHQPDVQPLGSPITTAGSRTRTRTSLAFMATP